MALSVSSTPPSPPLYYVIFIFIGNFATGTFNHSGGSLFVEAYEFTLTIPPGAIDEGLTHEITLRVLTEKPDNLRIKADEVIASFGFHCSPPGLCFKKPLRLTIPHCFNHTQLRDINFALYTGNHLKEGKDKYVIKIFVNHPSCSLQIHVQKHVIIMLA